MSKSSRRRSPIAQYDNFMMGSKTAKTPRGILLFAGGLIGNTALWLLGLINVARIGMVFAIVLITVIVTAVLQRVAPTLELSSAVVISAIIALILVAIGVIIVKLALNRDAKRLGEQPIFGVLDEDARTRDKQNYRRKSGR
jgi:hypothetical protein